MTLSKNVMIKFVLDLGKLWEEFELDLNKLLYDKHKYTDRRTNRHALSYTQGQAY